MSPPVRINCPLTQHDGLPNKNDNILMPSMPFKQKIHLLALSLSLLLQDYIQSGMYHWRDTLHLLYMLYYLDDSSQCFSTGAARKAFPKNAQDDGFVCSTIHTVIKTLREDPI